MEVRKEVTYMGKHNSKTVDNKERKKIVALLKEKGYVEQPKRGTGSHTVYKNSVTGDVKVLTLKLNKMIARRIEKELYMRV